MISIMIIIVDKTKATIVGAKVGTATVIEVLHVELGSLEI